MKRTHFEALRPVCPVCCNNGLIEAPLRLASVSREAGDTVLEGILHCGNESCQREFPILDGLPILVPDVRNYAYNQIHQLLARDDLSPETESLLGDCCGPGSPYDVMRQYLNCYAWDHYGEFDPQEAEASPKPGAVARTLNALLPNLPKKVGQPILDVGCAVGRSTFALAEHSGELVLGVDLNFSMLRLAARVLNQGVVRYPRRRVGLVYDRREFAVELPGKDLVDFWVCDALAPPFAPASFAAAVALNVLDCVRSPVQLLKGLLGAINDGGSMALTTPYDWSLNAAAPDQWLGGHSQRGPHRGDSEPVLRGLLTPAAYPHSLSGVCLIAEMARLPWRVRVHERSATEYELHAVVAKKLAVS